MITNKCGVYKITNIITGDYYIGSSANLSRRLKQHRVCLTGNRHGNSHLQNAWNKYSENNFEFSICECCEKERLLEREQFYIDNEKPSYNILQIAGSRLGYKHTDEARRKISEAQIGKHPSEAARAKNSGEHHHMFGKHHSEESLAKMSEAHTGKHYSEESKRKNSESHIGALNYLFGKHPSNEARAKNSEAHMGKHPTEETRHKLSEAHIGKHHSEESRAKMSEARHRYFEAKKVNVVG